MNTTTQTTDTQTVNRCACGKRIGRYARTCTKCFNARSAQLRTEGLALVSSGLCPVCGRALRLNLSITGWYQCTQFGAETHRADGSKPACEFQVIVPEK